MSKSPVEYFRDMVEETKLILSEAKNITKGNFYNNSTLTIKEGHLLFHQ